MVELAGMNDPLGIPQEPEGPLSMSTDVGQCMFDTMGRPPTFAPSSAEMAKAMEDVRVQRKVEFKEIVSRTYDLGKEADNNQYTLDMEHITIGTGMKTHMLMDKPAKVFLADEAGARYIAYLEWMEFRLIESPVNTVGAG